MPRGKALILPLWPGSPRHELAPGRPGRRGGRRHAKSCCSKQCSSSPSRVGEGERARRGAHWRGKEGREAASHLLLLLRPRFGSSLPFSSDKNDTPFNWILLSFGTNDCKKYIWRRAFKNTIETTISNRTTSQRVIYEKLHRERHARWTNRSPPSPN